MNHRRLSPRAKLQSFGMEIGVSGVGPLPALPHRLCLQVNNLILEHRQGGGRNDCGVDDR